MRFLKYAFTVWVGVQMSQVCVAGDFQQELIFEDQQLALLKTTYGHTLEGRPLNAYRFYKKSSLTKRKALLLTEGMHGNEYLGMLDELVTQRQGQDLLRENFELFVNQGGVVVIVPQVNPDGIARSSRLNSQGRDLNREFIKGALDSNESLYLTQWIDRELKDLDAKLEFAADYHCCGSFLLYPETTLLSPLQDFKKVLLPFQEHFSKDFQVGLTKDLFGYKTFGTLKDYLNRTYGTLSFTVEATSMEKGFDLKGHLDWWGKVSRKVLEDRVSIAIR